MKFYSDITERVNGVSHSHLALLLAFVFIICCANSVAADEGAFYVNHWGSYGQFEGPSGVAIDSAGFIYVADRGNHSIRKFAPNGDHVHSWGGLGTADGEFNSPRGIAIDNLDNLYVADELNNRIQKFDSSGTFLLRWGSYGNRNNQFDRPFAVAVRGNVVYVADSNNHRIQKFQYFPTFGGVVFASAWGSYGTGESEFKYPRGIAVDVAGNVYVADSTNNRIQQFDNSNTFVRFVGGTAQFNSPRGLALDANGALYVADYNNHRIVKLAYGYYIGEWGVYGTTEGRFRFPQFVAVGDVCTIVVSDTSNDRVQKFACDNSNFRHTWGKQGREISEFNRPQGIAVDAAGNVYVADTNNHRIQKFNPSGSFILKWGKFGPGDSEFNHPTSVAVDRENNVYVADRDNNRIQKFTSSGAYLMQWSGYITQFDHPTHVAVDSFPYVYVVDAQKVWRFTKTGTIEGYFGPGDGSNYGNLTPRSVTTDTDPLQLSSKVLYVTNQGSASTPDIRKYAVNYSNYNFPYEANYVGRQEGTFHGLAVDRDHNFYSFNSSTDRVQKFVSTFSSSGGTYVYFHEWGTSGTANRQFNGPSAIVVDKNCNIYVVDADNHRIQKFSTVPALNIF